MPENDFSRLETRVKALVEEIKLLRVNNRDLQKALAEVEQDKVRIDKERNEIRSKVNSLLALVESLEEDNGKND
jgi:regulator of replication initiation timing